MKAATRRLLEEQIVVVAVLGSGKKSDAMWHVPQLAVMFRDMLAFIHTVLTNQAAASLCLSEIVTHRHMWPIKDFAFKQMYRNYYWCLQTSRQIKNSRVYNKIE